jgi:hypothetical protein
MTGQRRDPFDLQGWKLENGNGWIHSRGSEEPAPGITGLPFEIDRFGATVFTVGYLAYLHFLGEAVGGFLVSLLYIYLMTARWRAIGLRASWAPQTLSIYLAYQVTKDSGVSYPIAQFLVLAPAVFACIAPAGIGLPAPNLDANQRVGRTGFILWFFPFLVLVAASYWSGLDRLLSQAWTLVGPAIDHVPVETTFWYFCLVIMGPACARMNDVGLHKWCITALLALMLARGAVQLSQLFPQPIPFPYATLPDLIMVTVGLCLSLLPSCPCSPLLPETGLP